MSLDALQLGLLLLTGLGAGALGALVGIGGGVMVVPVLVLGFGTDVQGSPPSARGRSTSPSE